MLRTTESTQVPVFEELRAILEDGSPPEASPQTARRPGRPAKKRGETAPVILHLYKAQIAWLDHYAEMISQARPDNKRLSRVEVVRGLLLGLGQFALERKIPFPLDLAVTSERDLQHAIAAALRRASPAEGAP
jgi:hypothetical protein